MSEGGAAPDQPERDRALDPSRSFLVQAPAGAGKTELLIRRYLRLLATVREPEEILAVTFTRKAAAEMQRRIVMALTDTEIVDSSLIQLVAAARARDLERGWNLAGHPARLRIGTIDGLNAALARTAPVTAGASVLRRITEQPQRLYQLASRATLRLLIDGDAPGRAVAALLRHLDNAPGRIEGLLAQLLARRDQWLPFAGAHFDPVAVRRSLESGLQRIVNRELDRVTAMLPEVVLAPLVEVLHAAAINREVLCPGGPGAGHAPGERLGWWQSAAETFLTQAGVWRKKLTVAQGFPREQAELKVHALALLEAQKTIPDLEAQLATVLQLPAPNYPDTQWAALEALLHLLPFAAAQLKVVFSTEGETDYIEIAAEAKAALGNDEAPTELALRVDWRLQHILLDEFQDTSQPQYDLLRALTRGWSPGDGRTLFLVGDPMQSIYRFRQAEVRMFLEAKEHGLPDVALEFLRLSANFRSVPPLVEWVNASFAHVFPDRDDPVTGAISFAPSAPYRSASETAGEGVALHATPWESPEAEGAAVVAVVRDHLQQRPENETVGILVRSRSHAAEIIAVLTAAGIPFAAPDLVILGRTTLASDLLMLTRALLHAGDRLAWLSVLRAPWCGLSLADLEELGSNDAPGTLFDLAAQVGVTHSSPQLSTDGRARVARLVAAFELAWSRVGQIPLRDAVEGLWLELGGPAVAGGDLPLADLLFEQIGKHDTGGDCLDVLALGRALDQAPASLGAANARVQVMTVHKAKGLEFDCVIVPGLGRGTRRDSRPALLWQELPHGQGTLDLLLAPINAAGSADDPLYEMLWTLRRQQELAEADRLLYVAATRAREQLHLFGQTREGRPAAGSLLDRLWPSVGSGWPIVPDGLTTTDPDELPDPFAGWRQPTLSCLPAGWRRPDAPRGLQVAAEPTRTARELIPFDWATAWARQAGAVAHRWLQQIATEGIQHYAPSRIETLRPRFHDLLIRNGVEGAAMERATSRVVSVLQAAVTDEQGRWLLALERTDARNEFAVTMLVDGRFRHLVVDRAFVDNDGVRWIIDYKTSTHEGGDREAFVRSEVARYADQLAAYRDAFTRLESRPIRTALYFPLLQLLQTVEAPQAVM